MKWRLLELKTYDGFINMAIDEAILKSVENNQSDPTIRFYKWKPGCISLGYRQKIEDINLNLCKQLGIDIVRRITGGRAVYHHTTDLTYSLTVSESSLGFTKRQIIKESHRYICQHIIDALNKMGIDGALYTLNDIRVNNKKISGSAQNLTPIDGRKVILQHGTFLLNYDEDLMRKLIPDDIESSTISLSQLISLTELEIYSILKESFLKGKQFEIGELTELELKVAQELVETKYTKDWWTIDQGTVFKGSCYQRPGQI